MRTPHLDRLAEGLQGHDDDIRPGPTCATLPVPAGVEAIELR